MTDEQQDKPKIIVDDDWKERVEAEREALKKDPGGEPEGAEGPRPAAEAEPEVPPASFPLLVTSLATQALAAMGQIPDPRVNQPVLRLDVAKHHIDTLAVLEEKTKGNLGHDESEMLGNVLHELRMLFVAVKREVANQGSKPSKP